MRMVIYCPTDVAVNTGSIKQSQFVRYFQINAHRLQFKKLIATCLVSKAAGETDADLEKVQNCYILERRDATKQQRMAWSKNSNNLVVDEYEDSDADLKYKNEDGSTHTVPYHIINQAVTAATGRFTIVKRYIDHYDAETNEPILGEQDWGITWNLQGYNLKIKWCKKHPDGTIEPLPNECYYINIDAHGKDFITDFSVFPRDEDGNPCFEEVGQGSVCLYPPEYYDYQEIEYAEYEEYYEHCPDDMQFVSGDYRSQYCQKLFEEADVVVTNPPFSIFRDFVDNLEKHNLKYLILGGQNAVTYKEIFPLIKDNRLWLGTVQMGSPLLFIVDESYQQYLKEYKAEGKGYKIVNNEVFARVPSIWFTNLDYAQRHENILLIKQYDKDTYFKYDNYDAIDVGKVSDIPKDYQGVMGVPISFLSKYNPDQFVIKGQLNVGCYMDDNGWQGAEGKNMLSVNGKTVYKRVLIQRKE